MKRSTVLILATILIVAARAQGQLAPTDITENEEHWLFEFDMSSKKALGTRDDIREIRALCLAAAKLDSHSAPVSGTITAWMSPSQTVTKLTYADAVRGALLFVMEKKDTHWFIVHQYHVPNFPPKPNRPNQSLQPTAGRFDV